MVISGFFGSLVCCGENGSGEQVDAVSARKRSTQAGKYEGGQFERSRSET